MSAIKVMAIDPGRTTGYTYARLLPNEWMEYYPFQELDEVDELWDRVAAFQPRYIIMEDFEYRNRARVGLDLYPQQLIGIATLYEKKAKHDVALYLQKAATGKAHYSDNVLKSHNLYKRGVPHGMDASRHLLHWLTFGPGFQFLGPVRISEFAKLLDHWEG